jgi:hypothetical protein
VHCKTWQCCFVHVGVPPAETPLLILPSCVVTDPIFEGGVEEVVEDPLDELEDVEEHESDEGSEGEFLNMTHV